MPLIKSISGIRGTIGGYKDNLNPINIIRYVSSYCTILKNNYKNDITILIGRDGRKSGYTISKLVISTVQNMGINVVDLDLCTTPTIGLGIIIEKAHGGIMLTASHND